ncbi:hypothetical protein ACFL96_08435 [Thermoproteota archaeon]
MKCKIIRKWWFWVIIAVLLIAFLFPKPAGHEGGPKQPEPYTWINEECLCLGYKFHANPNVMDVGQYYMCIGIPVSCECKEWSSETKETKIIDC